MKSSACERAALLANISIFNQRLAYFHPSGLNIMAKNGVAKGLVINNNYLNVDCVF